MFKRELSSELQALAKEYLILTILGPRQSGKTTLVRAVFPDLPYVNLEALDIRSLAEMDPREFLDRYGSGAILGEIQRVPSLLSYLQVLVDQKEQKGMFILTGSHQLALHEAIAQSLAGRTALLTLLPMSLKELQNEGIDLPLDDSLLLGGYPRIYNDHQRPFKAYRNYVQTYVERDVRQLINVKDLVQFERFIRVCAGRVGQIIKQEEIGGEIGISSHTVKEWLSILEASFVIFRLQPYFENFGKRVIKSPKLYFTDVGLAAYLLGIEETYQMQRDPLRGHLFENLVILELMKERLNRGFDPQLYYYRDVQKNEVDVIFKNGRELIPIEIKSSKTFNSEFLSKIELFQKISKSRSPRGVLIYAGEQEQQIRSVRLLHYKHAFRAFSGEV